MNRKEAAAKQRDFMAPKQQIVTNNLPIAVQSKQPKAVQTNLGASSGKVTNSPGCILSNDGDSTNKQADQIINTTTSELVERDYNEIFG